MMVVGWGPHNEMSFAVFQKHRVSEVISAVSLSLSLSLSLWTPTIGISDPPPRLPPPGRTCQHSGQKAGCPEKP